MKKYITLLISIISFYVSDAQSYEPGTNFENNSLQKFEGTWIWTNANDKIIFILKKENIAIPVPENSHADAIVGFHLYQLNGIAVESSLDFSNTIYGDKKSTILGGNKAGDDILTGTIRDLSKNKLLRLVLVLNSDHTQIQASIKPLEGISVGEAPGITLPASFTLYKQ